MNTSNSLIKLQNIKLKNEKNVIKGQRCVDFTRQAPKRHSAKQSNGKRKSPPKKRKNIPINKEVMYDKLFPHWKCMHLNLSAMDSNPLCLSCRCKIINITFSECAHSSYCHSCFINLADKSLKCGFITIDSTNGNHDAIIISNFGIKCPICKMDGVYQHGVLMSTFETYVTLGYSIQKDPDVWKFKIFGESLENAHSDEILDIIIYRLMKSKNPQIFTCCDEIPRCLFID